MEETSAPPDIRLHGLTKRFGEVVAVDAGAVELAGREVASLPPYDREVNTVFQDYALFPHMNVAENIEYGMRVRGVDKAGHRRSWQLE